MGAMSADRRLAVRLADLLDPREEILEAYLFGSHARGGRNLTATSMLLFMSTTPEPTTPATAIGRI